MVFVLYAVFSYVLSLYGNNVFLLDYSGLHQDWNINDGAYLIVVLPGKIK